MGPCYSPLSASMADNYNRIPALQRIPHTRDTINQRLWTYVHFLISSKTWAAEVSQKYQVHIDPYTKMTRLDLYQFDGTPIHPMFLAFSPPQMLPTVTMNPTAEPTGKKAKRTAGAGEELAEPLNKNAMHVKRDFERPMYQRIDPAMVWWAGIGMTLFGGAAYLL